MSRTWTVWLVACIVLLRAAGSAAEVSDQSFALRNHNPFLQIYGLPPFQNAVLAPEGEFGYAVSFDLANHAETEDTPAESVIIDGESQFLSLSMRYRAKPWLEIGFDLPFISHSGGTFDQEIDSWHNIWGLTNSERKGPRDQIHFFYDGMDAGSYDLQSSASGIGDMQLTAAVPLSGGPGTDKPAITLRTSLKLPTGDSKSLLGSGATDLSVGLYVTDNTFTRLNLSGFVGILLLGDGDVLPEIQEQAVVFGGIATTWQATQRFGVTLQVNAQTPYFDSDVEELGGNSVQAALGGTYRFRDSKYSLSIAVVEDLFSNATTDVALQIAVSAHGGQ